MLNPIPEIIRGMKKMDDFVNLIKGKSSLVLNFQQWFPSLSS